MANHRIPPERKDSRPLHMVAGAIAMVLVIGTIDYITGSQVSIAPLYLVSVYAARAEDGKDCVRHRHRHRSGTSDLEATPMPELANHRPLVPRAFVHCGARQRSLRRWFRPWAVGPRCACFDPRPTIVRRFLPALGWCGRRWRGRGRDQEARGQSGLGRRARTRVWRSPVPSRGRCLRPRSRPSARRRGSRS